MNPHQEWLESNGLGGFASSTTIGMNTRRYHGLLTAATKPPAGRMSLLSKFEEVVTVNGRRYELSANQYPGVIHPRGDLLQKDFHHDPFPVFTYSVDGFEIIKTVFMVHNENTTVVEYELKGPANVEAILEIRPLIAFRDFHSTTHENGSIDGSLHSEPGIVKLTPYLGLSSLYLAHNAQRIEPTGDWYRNFEYTLEQERGLDFHEDLYNPLVSFFRLTSNSSAVVIASTVPRMSTDAPALRAAEKNRRESIQRNAPTKHPLVRDLVAAADQFVVSRGDLKTIIAGYHWFGDWGRDTMISLPGLTLVTGRADVARDILRAFANSIDQGMLPNRFPDAGEEPEYNTADATLWFFEAIRSFLAYTGDTVFVRDELYPKLKDIIEWHQRGTRYGIRVDSDGLLLCGEPGVQLTWMDAKVGDWVVTPRYGKPVEIQALWFNALCVMRDLATKFDGETSSSYYSLMAQKAMQSFDAVFWNEQSNCLFDVVNDAGADASIRPNQIFTVSLPHSMVSLDKARKLLEVVQRELFTPMGLRTLSPTDPAYRGRYEGGVWERDSAYHQGTVWPWLMGPFITAFLKVNKSKSAVKQAEKWLEGVQNYMREQGFGQLPEIADGDAPHQGRGCIAQAWSVAELLRTAVEDVYCLTKMETKQWKD